MLTCDAYIDSIIFHCRRRHLRAAEKLLSNGVTEYNLIFKQGMDAHTIHRIKRGEVKANSPESVVCNSYAFGGFLFFFLYYFMSFLLHGNIDFDIIIKK